MENYLNGYYTKWAAIQDPEKEFKWGYCSNEKADSVVVYEKKFKDMDDSEKWFQFNVIIHSLFTKYFDSL